MHVLARDQVVATHHVGLGLLELGAVLLIRPTGELFLLRPDQPCDVVVFGLPAVWTMKLRALRFYTLVKKLALVHGTIQMPAPSRQPLSHKPQVLHNVFPRWHARKNR